jgi:hypothetical protein
MLLQLLTSRGYLLPTTHYSFKLSPLLSRGKDHAAQKTQPLCCCRGVLSLSLMLRPTVSQPVCLGAKHPSGAYDQIFITCVTVTVFFLWGALSDERSGLSFVCAAGPCQRNLSRVWVPWDLRPYFTASHLRLPFSSPPTTRRVTVEVFDSASTRVRGVLPRSSLANSLSSDQIENTFHSCRVFYSRVFIDPIQSKVRPVLSRIVVRITQQWTFYQDSVSVGTCLSCRCLAVGRYVTIIVRISSKIYS